MVGVPKSTGCATCRTRKMKCDEAKPSCLKCRLSDFHCPGYPSRLKFQDEGTSLKRKYSLKRKTAGPSGSSIMQGASSMPYHISNQGGKSISLPKFPLSPSDKLASRFCQLLGSHMQVVAGTNLAAFGKFMIDVPLHIGHSKVLDLSVEALYLAHNAVFGKDPSQLLRSQILYSKALQNLQKCLEDKDQARSPETLCATVMLSIYECVGTEESAAIQHAGGAVTLIKVKGPGDFEDTFAREILNSLRRKTIIDDTTAGKECFLDAPRWKQIFSSESLRDSQGFDVFFSLTSEVPGILETFRALTKPSKQSEPGVMALRDRASLLRSHLQSWRDNPRRKDAIRINEQPSTNPHFPKLLSYQSINEAGLHCTYLAIMILLNFTLSRLQTSRSQFVDTIIFQEESEKFAMQVCQSYEYCAKFSPFGNLYMKFALQAAYLAISREYSKDWIVDKLHEMSASSRISPMSIICVDDLLPFGYLNTEEKRPQNKKSWSPPWPE